ncbi:MAG: gliding motility protein GldL [Prevotellaceae bacterium]|nr:gliding motility protein GldL [Prevotellaceae bacterium]
MTEYSKFNIVYRLQRWLDSVPGQTFLNYAYSWGASIVILGTLFKLTHLPGANIMLYLGMGTEVIVFFISAFDRPFDKTADGKDLPTHVADEEDEEIFDEGDDETVSAEAPAAAGQVNIIGGGSGVSTVILGGGGIPSGSGEAASMQTAAEGEGVQPVAGTVPAGQLSVDWVARQQQVSPEMEEATSNYVDELKRLTEMLGKVSEQSMRLTRDSEEMENLNRTLTGICKVYEMQLKGASSQIGTIDQINEQSRKMAAQIEQLNKIYARMIEAMTVNMRAAAPNSANPEV